jgi:hypothetical protein
VGKGVLRGEVLREPFERFERGDASRDVFVDSIGLTLTSWVLLSSSGTSVSSFGCGTAILDSSVAVEEGKGTFETPSIASSTVS